MYEWKADISNELTANQYRITQNERSGKRICPLIAETLINTGISGFSNHRMTHYKCIFRKTVPPLKAETTINTDVSRLSNHRDIYVWMKSQYIKWTYSQSAQNNTL